MHILIVEDNPTLQEALQLHFTDDGHLVTALEDGEQALHFLVQEPFDCCILDVNLPHVRLRGTACRAPQGGDDAYLIVDSA